MVWSLIMLVMSLLMSKAEFIIITLTTIIITSKLYVFSNQLEMKYFYIDSMSMSMSHLSIVLSCIALIVYLKINDSSKSLLCLLSGMVAFLFFHCNNLLFFFILFEASLIPLLIMIIGWGKQPERIMAGQYIMIYTLISSLPLFCSVMWMEEEGLSLSMSNATMHNNYSSHFSLFEQSHFLNFIIVLSFLLAFLVKVPVFFLHSWLPKAHVEAPLEGSIILAGIMLKVGTFGIFRLSNFLSSNSMNFFTTLIFSISLIGSVWSVLMAISSDDLKLSIALSSISHMNFLLSSILSFKEMSMSMATFTMISHGFSSSILFFFVTMIYELNNSRSILIVKGCMSKMPSVLLFSFIFFSISISLPPSLAFFGEMLSIFSIWSISIESIFMVNIYILVNSFYSMMNFIILNHSAKLKLLKISNSETMFNFNSAVALLILLMTFFFPESVL